MAQDKGKTTERRVIIHCGVQKTASTAFHHFVQKNRDALSAHLDIRTPVKGSLMRDLGRVAALYSLGEASEARFISLIEDMRDALADGDLPVLLSHENLPGAMLGRGGVVTLYPRLEAILGLLDTHLAPLRPTFVFYTRRMEVWKKSVYNQAVRSDGYAGTQADFLADTAGAGDWAGLEARASACLGADRVRFLRIEDETDSTRPGLQLLHMTGLPDAVVDRLTPLEGRRNESLNAGALEFMRRLNGLGLPRPARRKLAGLVLESQTLFREEAVA